MKLSELYGHKAEYETMLAALAEHKDLPCVDDASASLYKALDACRHYEKWRIDFLDWCFRGMVDACLHTGPVLEIPNQEIEGHSQPVVFDAPREMFKIWFSTGAYTFGDDYPCDLFDEFFAEVQQECPPSYVDDLNHALYYAPDDAGKAYEVCCTLLKRYRARYSENRKARRIAALEKELALLKEGRQ